jgi:hypothetical protein
MIQVRRAIGILTSIVVVCAGAVVLQTRAADQQRPPAATRDKAAPAPAVHAAKSPLPAAGGIGSGGVGGRPGAPQVPEESATIRDDPTIAPDPRQSADNNVSFPNDI